MNKDSAMVMMDRMLDSGIYVCGSALLAFTAAIHGVSASSGFDESVRRMERRLEELLSWRSGAGASCGSGWCTDYDLIEPKGYGYGNFTGSGSSGGGFGGGIGSRGESFRKIGSHYERNAGDGFCE